MHFKLIMAIVEDTRTDAVVRAAREGGATGCTVITCVRGEGLRPGKTFLGLDLTSARDVLLFVVAAPLAREILETIAKAGHFDEEPGSGIALQIEIEDAVGLKSQLPAIQHEIEEDV
ncbi:MAG: P-II family nitrogen regulator [Alphaproteobacteria bacterium]|nr:MAG: P-II family nitrogen regulator [Alphaproteobacteria bacterium]